MTSRNRRRPSLLTFIVVLALAAQAAAQPVPRGPEVTLYTGSSSFPDAGTLVAQPGGGYVATFGGTFDPLGFQRFAADGSARGSLALVEPARPNSGMQGFLIAAGRDGSVTAVWSAFDASDGRTDVYTRRYAADDRALGPAVIVNQTLPQDQYGSAVAGSPDGRILVVWRDVGYDVGCRTMARWLDGGQPVGDEFEVHTTRGACAGRAAVAIDGDGNIVVVSQFVDLGSTLVARFLAPDGSPRGADVTVAQDVIGGDVPAVVTPVPGGFVVFWMQLVPDPNATPFAPGSLIATRLSATGVVEPYEQVAAGVARAMGFSGRSFDAAADVHGNVLVAYTEGSGIKVRTVDAASGEPSEAVAITDGFSGMNPLIAGSGGGFLAAWSVGDSTIHARPLSLCGNTQLEAGETCDDGNGVTGDCCSPACTAELLPARCYRLAGSAVLRLSATVHAGGRTASCKARCRTENGGTLMLFDDGTYRWPQGGLTCTDGERVRLPDEIGTVRTRGDRLLLHADNLPVVRDAVRICSGIGLRSSRASLSSPAADGQINGKQLTRIRRPGKTPVSTRAQTQFVAVPFEQAREGEAPPVNQSIPVCGEQVVLRCTLQ